MCAAAIGIERSGVSQFDAATDIVLLRYAMSERHACRKLAVERTAIRDALRAAKDLLRLKVQFRSAKMAMHSSRCILLKCKVVAGILSEQIRRECEESDIALIDEGIRPRDRAVFPHGFDLGVQERLAISTTPDGDERVHFGCNRRGRFRLVNDHNDVWQCRLLALSGHQFETWREHRWKYEVNLSVTSPPYHFCSFACFVSNVAGSFLLNL
jgi:hypothetical protein